MPDLDMSPYAAFVWSAWALSALVLAVVAVRALAASRRWRRELAGLEVDAPRSAPIPRSSSAKRDSAQS